jgi:hypothetical protein
MQLPRSIAAMLALAAAAAAQSTFTSPRALGAAEGNDWWSFMFGHPIARWQQIDGTQRGAPIANINRIELRQDGITGSQSAVARNVDLEIVMAHTDYATSVTLYATNYRTPATVVFTKKPVSLPAWTSVPPSTPAPWTLAFPFDAGFNYNGTQDLLWETRVDNSSLAAFATYPQDFHANRTLNYVNASLTGNGCTTANGLFQSNPLGYTDAAALFLQYEVFGAPSTTPVTLLVGASDPNQAIPGLCANLRSSMNVLVGIGTSGATGVLVNTPLRVTWNAAYSSATLYTQMVALDPTQSGLPLALSQGRREVMPPYLGVSYSLRGYYNDGSLVQPLGTLWNGGFAARFRY